MRKYFFGYLFVRIAKLLAMIVVLIGIAYAMLQFAQAMIAVESNQYSSNPKLRRELDRLSSRFADTQNFVFEFTGDPNKARGNVPARLQGGIGSARGLERIVKALEDVDRQRQELKQMVVEQFERVVNEIQEKLRAHAALLSPEASAAPLVPPTPPPAPAATVTPDEPKMLFSDRLSRAEIDARLSALEVNQQFLKVLETTAENPDNRARLAESIQLVDAFKALLPWKTEPLVGSQKDLLPTWQLPTAEPLSEPRKALKAEKVAEQLGQLRSSVRKAILSSWALDDAFDQVRDLVAFEGDKCRLATLSVRRIWLNAFWAIAAGTIATVFTAFLVLVTADLTQTLLDTATNTGALAERQPK